MDPRVGEVGPGVRKFQKPDTLSLIVDSCTYGHLGKHRSGTEVERYVDGDRKKMRANSGSALGQTRTGRGRRQKTRRPRVAEDVELPSVLPAALRGFLRGRGKVVGERKRPVDGN